MKKLIMVGDVHGRASWKIPAYNEEYDKLVFLGDYFDTRDDISAALQIYNFQEICAFKKQYPDKVVLLIGNHDYHYFPEIGDSGYSGYQNGAAVGIGYILNENRHILQMAYRHDNILCTHAGVSKTWLTNQGYYEGNGVEENNICLPNIDDFINDLWKYKPKMLGFSGIDNTGEDVTQSPIWIRPRSLMRDSKDLGYIQIVGHTTQNQIDIQGKSTGGKYYFIDTLGTSGEYLIYENNKFTTKTV